MFIIQFASGVLCRGSNRSLTGFHPIATRNALCGPVREVRCVHLTGGGGKLCGIKGVDHLWGEKRVGGRWHTAHTPKKPVPEEACFGNPAWSGPDGSSAPPGPRADPGDQLRPTWAQRHGLCRDPTTNPRPNLATNPNLILSLIPNLTPPLNPSHPPNRTPMALTWFCDIHGGV